MTDLTAAQAAQQPTEITLDGGATAHLRYTFRSLALLEQRFGSVTAIQDAIDQTGDGAAFGPLLDLIGAGLIGRRGGFTPHLRHHVSVSGVRTLEEIIYKRSSDGVELGDLLDPRRIAEYAAAMQEALVSAFGVGATEDGQGNGGEGAA